MDPLGNRSVVPGAVVRVNGRSVSLQTTSDGQGSYMISGVRAGSYQLRITGPWP
ncbi:MAG: carboxypeptidase regulatory-like domain-containing protein [Acidobacteriaceae bacterium]|nr:carboxypeptidase regulatory-like domain-containing protein [Acidobacteriaceae bacterium]